MHITLRLDENVFSTNANLKWDQITDKENLQNFTCAKAERWTHNHIVFSFTH